MSKLKIVFLLVLVVYSSICSANKITKAFSALKSYNYFEAKQSFEKLLKKEPAVAAYGLSNIYYRTDNPFSNIDTAYKFILQSENVFKALPLKNKVHYLKYRVSEHTIVLLKHIKTKIRLVHSINLLDIIPLRLNWLRLLNYAITWHL